MKDNLLFDFENMKQNCFSAEFDEVIPKFDVQFIDIIDLVKQTKK